MTYLEHMRGKEPREEHMFLVVNPLWVHFQDHLASTQELLCHWGNCYKCHQFYVSCSKSNVNRPCSVTTIDCKPNIDCIKYLDIRDSQRRNYCTK